MSKQDEKDKKKPQGRFPVCVIAHRGASGSSPENTMAAFRWAIEAGSDMIELDVHLSADGEVMVTHNDSVDAKTNGRGKVADLTRRELQSLDAGSWFGPEFAGERIPALEEVIALAGDKVMVNVEIKAGYTGSFTMDDLVERTLAVVENQSMLDRVMFSSFFTPALKKIAACREDAALALLLRRPMANSEEAKSGFYRIINCHKDAAAAPAIISCRKQGIKVNIWTVNHEAEMLWFLKTGVDGIFTDFPGRLIRLLERSSGGFG